MLLQGELGAGKTCLCQGIAQGLGVAADEAVTSPSYTLLNIYRGRCPLVHADLYRLGDLEELEDIGFADYQDGQHVLLVEWIDRFPEYAPDGLRVAIDYGGRDRERVLTFSATAAMGRRLLDRLRQCLDHSQEKSDEDI